MEQIDLYSKNFGSALQNLVDNPDGVIDNSSISALLDTLSGAERFQIDEVIDTLNKGREVRNLNSVGSTIVNISGAFGVGKSQVAVALSSFLGGDQTFLVRESIDRNAARTDSIILEGDQGYLAMEVSQLHFLRQVAQGVFSGILQFAELGKSGFIIVDQSSLGQRSIRETKEKLTNDACLRLNSIDDILNSYLMNIRSVNVLLTADPSKLRDRIVERGEELDLLDESHQITGLKELQNTMIRNHSREFEITETVIINTTKKSVDEIVKEIATRVLNPKL